MVSLDSFPKDSVLLNVKGCLCVGSNEAATRPKKCCGKKKLPPERGGKTDTNKNTITK